MSLDWFQVGCIFWFGFSVGGFITSLIYKRGEGDNGPK
jgi:hypothetical protein